MSEWVSHNYSRCLRWLFVETGVTLHYSLSSFPCIPVNRSEGSLTQTHHPLPLGRLVFNDPACRRKQEGILMGYRKRGSGGAAQRERCRKQRNGVFSGNICFCLITLRTGSYPQNRRLPHPGVSHQDEELSCTVSPTEPSSSRTYKVLISTCRRRAAI